MVTAQLVRMSLECAKVTLSQRDVGSQIRSVLAAKTPIGASCIRHFLGLFLDFFAEESAFAQLSHNGTFLARRPAHALALPNRNGSRGTWPLAGIAVANWM